MADGDPSTMLIAPFGDFADVSSDAIIALGANGEVIRWNRMAERVLGPRLIEVRGEAINPFFGNGVVWTALLARALGGERVSGVRMDVIGVAARKVPVQLALIPGDGTGCTLVLRDLSEQVIAQQTLAENEVRVRRSEALALTGSFVLDAHDLSEQWSDGMYRIHAADPENFTVSASSHIALVLEEDRDRVWAAFERALAGEVPPGVDHRVRRLDGGLSYVFLAVEPRTDLDGNLVGLSGVCQDVNARVAGAHALQEALRREQAVSDELRRVDALKDEFLATVSHELRTPLTSVVGFASLLKQTVPERAPLVEPIQRNAEEMLRMIRRLLDQARLESGRVLLEPTTLPLRESVDDVLAQSASVLSGADISVDIPADLTIFMDPDALTHVLSNLVGNAAKYAPEARISIVARRSEDDVIVSVADTGPGIAPEFQEHLFDPFFQVPGALRASRGTGFGLAIVRRYVELHEGMIWCESTVGVGTTFSFTIRSGPVKE